MIVINVKRSHLSHTSDTVATPYGIALAAPAAVSPPQLRWSDGAHVSVSWAQIESRKSTLPSSCALMKKGEGFPRCCSALFSLERSRCPGKEAWRSGLATSQKKEETDTLHSPCSRMMLESTLSGGTVMCCRSFT